ncbi:hypothetical protein ACR6C2_16945 [Streptomyces sp. INA 01156]
MKHTHMAVGMIPEDLVNISVIVQWTPGHPQYTLTLIDEKGEALKGQEYHCEANEPIGYNPPIMDLDVKTYHGLPNYGPLATRLAQSLGGFGYFQWFSPAGMSGVTRAKYEGAVK